MAESMNDVRQRKAKDSPLTPEPATEPPNLSQTHGHNLGYSYVPNYDRGDATIQEYRTINDYARKALRPWLSQYYMWNQFYSMLPFYSMAFVPPPFPGQTSTAADTRSSENGRQAGLDAGSAQRLGYAGRPREAWQNNVAQNQRAQEPAAAFIGTEFKLPTFWKRVAAELIDFTFLFYIKLLVTVMVVQELGIIWSSLTEDEDTDDGDEEEEMEEEEECLLIIMYTMKQLNKFMPTPFTVGLEMALSAGKGTTFDYSVIFDLDEIDYDKAFAITSEVIAMEIINRLLITLFETLCLRRGIGVVGGATPGKRLLGLKVVSCQDIRDLGAERVLVVPAGNMGWTSAFVRSVIKNFTIAFFFPACLTIFMFRHNRAAYDVLAGTIVVQAEDNEDPRQ